MIEKGMIFKHKSYKDLSWNPGPNESWSDAPMLDMEVTKVTKHEVHYGYKGDKIGFAKMSRARFEEKYA